MVPESRSSSERYGRLSAAAAKLAAIDEERRLYERWFRPGGLEAFCWEACRTRDEHDAEHSIKPLPDLDFLHLFFRLCQSERWLNVAKSRQVFMTWATYVYALWRILARPNQAIALIPKKQADGERHVEGRIKETLWFYLPEWLKRQYTIAPIKGTFHVTSRLDFDRKLVPWSSFLVVYPQGAEQLRSFTHSVVIGDEVAHQRGHAEWWRAAVPTVQTRAGRGGQIIQLSSAKRGSFFQAQLGPTIRDAVRAARDREVLRHAAA